MSCMALSHMSFWNFWNLIFVFPTFLWRVNIQAVMYDLVFMLCRILPFSSYDLFSAISFLPFISFVRKLPLSGAKELIKCYSHSQVCFSLFTKWESERSLPSRWGSGDWEETGRNGKSNKPKNKDLELEVNNIYLTVHSHHIYYNFDQNSWSIEFHVN